MPNDSAQSSPRTQTNVPTQPDKPSLYERLGGIYSIACVVDDLIDRIMTDARLNANPAVNEAHHRVPPPGFKYLVTEMVGWATGGPQKYTGRTMLESHEHLNIERTIAFNETDRKLAEREVNSNRSVSLGRQGRA